MGKRFLILSGISIGVILLLVLLSFVCKSSETGMTLYVTVDTPQDESIVTASPVTVSGTVNKTATVKINDVVVPVKGNKFSTSVTLTEGTNVITVVATSVKPSNIVRKTLTITYTPAKT